MVSFLGLPMVKLGGLVLRTLTKPLAKRIKAQSRVHPTLNDVCHELGQRQNRALVKIDMRFRRVHGEPIPELSRDEAVANGADLLGEFLIFAVAVAVASNEYARSSTKARETKLANEREMEARFKRVERQVHWLEHKLQESGYTFQHDYPSRFNEERVAYESTVPDFEETIDALDDAREQYLGLPGSKFEEADDDFWRVDERAHGFRDRPQVLTAGRFARGEGNPSSSHASKDRTAEFRGYDFPSRFGEPVDDLRSRDTRGHHQQHPRSFLPRFKDPPSDATAPLQRDFGFRSGFGKPSGEPRAKSRAEPQQQQQQRRDRDFRWIGEPRMPLREPSFPRLGGFRL